MTSSAPVVVADLTESRTVSQKVPTQIVVIDSADEQPEMAVKSKQTEAEQGSGWLARLPKNGPTPKRYKRIRVPWKSGTELITDDEQEADLEPHIVQWLSLIHI